MSEQPPTGPGEPGGHDELGSVAEEAAKLFGALQDWAKDQSGEWATGVSGLAGQAASTARQVQDHLGENLANGSPECRYCPVCRTIHVVRQMSPEVRAHLTTAASSLLQAAAGVMATQVPPERRPGVERIDLDADDTEDPDAWGDQTDDPTDHPENPL
jgi:hypothetical protein